MCHPVRLLEGGGGGGETQLNKKRDGESWWWWVQKASGEGKEVLTINNLGPEKRLCFSSTPRSPSTTSPQRPCPSFRASLGSTLALRHHRSSLLAYLESLFSQICDNFAGWLDGWVGGKEGME